MRARLHLYLSGDRILDHPRDDALETVACRFADDGRRLLPGLLSHVASQGRTVDLPLAAG